MYTSWHLYNDQQIFTNMHVKNINFVTAANQIIWKEEISIILVPLLSDMTIKLHNVILALNYNLNLISLDHVYNIVAI